jgi:murein DD-endopeptidase MepM/ murein hydrolase activator NlpD
MAAPKILETIKLNNKKVKASTKVANETIENIRELIIKRTKVKKDVFTRTQIMQKRESENRKRLKRETVLEAPNFVKTPLGRQSLTTGIAQTGKGFLERIVSFIGYLAAGWILSNLPTWIAMAKEFIARIKRFKEIVGSVVSGVGNFFSGIKGVLDAFTANLLNLDFFDTSKRMDQALKDLSSTVDGIGRDIEEGFEIITTPLTEGKYSGEEIPETGTPSQDEGAYPSPTPPSTATPPSGKWKPILDMISEAESAGGSYDSRYGGIYPGYSKLTIAEADRVQRENYRRWGSAASGRYQFMNIGQQAAFAGLKPTDIFSPANQDRMAIALIEKKRKVTIDMIKNNPAEAQLRLAKEWAGIPIPGAERSFYPPPNKSTITNSRVREAFKQVTKKPQQQAPKASTPQPQVKISGGVSGRRLLLSASAKGADPVVGVTDRFGYSAWRGRHHNGIDIGTSKQKGYFVSFLRDGNIKLLPNNGAAGNEAQIISGGIKYRFLHLRRFLSKTGNYKAGNVIGEIGNTGRSTSEHLHYEVWPPGTRGVNPEPYLDLITIGKNLQKAEPVSFTKPQQTSTKPTAITPQRRGQDVVIIDDTRPTQQTAGGGGGYSPPQGQSNAFSTLNNFIKNKLLVGLSFL